MKSQVVSLALLLFLLGASTGTEKKHAKVIILGAGLSGIAAAKELLDNNITDFYVLEAQDYIGGRIHSVPFEGFTIETGANWVHLLDYEDTSPLDKLRTERKMEGIWCNYSDLIIRDEKGQNITDWQIIHRFDTLVEEKVEKFQSTRRKKNLPDIPARVDLQLMGWKSNRPIEKVIEYFRLDFEHAKRPELVSSYQMFTRGRDFFVSDPRGLWSMYEDLYKPVTSRILLRTAVSKIKYSSDSVEVHTIDGEMFSADYALCTFSTGVLASDMVSFEPPLPEDKKEAIFKNPMSLYTKVFLKFPRKFWDDHEYILHANRQRGRWPVFQDLDRPGILPKGSGILLATLTEDEARRVEGQTGNETQAEVMKTLREIYGQNIPDPTAIFYPRWSANPYTRGAYSEPVVGTTSEDFRQLGKRLGRLYFAGEATSEEWYGYMQGAYMTGQDKGQLISADLLRVEQERQIMKGDHDEL